MATSLGQQLEESTTVPAARSQPPRASYRTEMMLSPNLRLPALQEQVLLHARVSICPGPSACLCAFASPVQ